VSAAYPPDLVFKDLTGPSPRPGLNERGLKFRSTKDYARGFTISVSSNTEGLTPVQWLREYAACLPETVQHATAAGKPATFCTSVPEQVPEAAVAFEHMGKMLFITAVMPKPEFDQVIASLRP
jgi:hypothetical protein